MNAVRTLLKVHNNGNGVNNITLRTYAFKSDLKIKWVRPEKIPGYKPAKSGDLEAMKELSKSQPALEYRNCKELETADDLVKRLFSLEFQPRRKMTEVYIRDVIGQVQRHPLDKGSIEARIARWTGAIRSLQEQAEIHPLNRRFKVNLQELIDKRKKHLKYLRRWDYKRFEWLLEALNIQYKPPPTVSEGVFRKESLRRLTKKYCDGIVDDRLTAYKLSLEHEQPAFLEEKIRTLEFLRKEQSECGVEVTIKQEDIDETKKQLEELLKKRAAQQEDD